MGSFAATCCVSGLPIEAGDDVRYFLLTKNPYDDDNLRCYIHDLYFPRVYPLRAKYNDYGSVEEVEEGAAQQAWLDAFKLDLVQLGWGNNSCHDTSTSKDMTFDHMLEAAWEGRLRVRREVSMWALEPEVEKLMAEGREKRTPKKTIPVGVPTRTRIEKVLTAAGFTMFDGSHEKGSMIVARQGMGRIKVRVGDFGAELEPLQKAEAAIKAAGYATLITVGDGSSSFSGLLLVRPMAGTKDFYTGYPKDRKTPLPVKQAMIREDVWQALCSLNYEGYVDRSYKEKIVTVKDFREAARIAWDALASKKKSKTGLSEVLDTITSMSGSGGLSDIFMRDTIPFSVGLGTAFKIVAKKFRNDEMTDEEVQPFLDTAAEFAFLAALFTRVRYQWRPTYSNGPQFGEWGIHFDFFQQLLGVSAASVEKQRLEREDGG